MNTQDFDNYKFSANSKVKPFSIDRFYPVLEVDFEKRDIGFELGIINVEYIQEIID